MAPGHDHGDDLDHYRLSVLVERRVPHPDDAAVGLRVRGAHAQHLGFDPEHVAWTDGPGPTEFLDPQADQTRLSDLKPRLKACGVAS
jgi:hypothetical protein